MSTHTVEHNGHTYTLDLDGSEEAFVMYVGDRHNPHHRHQVDYRYELKGAHQGEPIEVWMLDVQEDMHSSVRRPTWDRLVWADDETPFEDGEFLDTYTDALRDDLYQLAAETWD